TFSFTGWKVGWVTASPGLVTAVRSAKQFLTYESQASGGERRGQQGGEQRAGTHGGAFPSKECESFLYMNVGRMSERAAQRR
ncbi:hypothetical protein ACWD9X_35480, partial [Streptomyces sp. NPDC005075]